MSSCSTLLCRYGIHSLKGSRRSKLYDLQQDTAKSYILYNIYFHFFLLKLRPLKNILKPFLDFCKKYPFYLRQSLRVFDDSYFFFEHHTYKMCIKDFIEMDSSRIALLCSASDVGCLSLLRNH